jgi:nucleoside-diphosphate kinase
MTLYFGGNKMSQTLVILKPDAVRGKLIGSVLACIESQCGLHIAAIVMVKPSGTFIDEIYYQYRDEDWYENHRSFMLSGDIVLVVVEGKNVVQTMRKLAGSVSNPQVGTIRHKWATGTTENVIHTSENEEVALQEIGVADYHYDLGV